MIIRRINPSTSELYHHGVKGQRWGVRRYQNPDGSLTPLGEKRFGTVKGLERAQANRKKILKTIGAGVGTAAAIGLGATAISNKLSRKSQEAFSLAKNISRSDLVGKAASATWNEQGRRLKKGSDTAQAIGVIASTGALAVSTFIAAGGATTIKQAFNVSTGKQYSNYAIKQIENEKMSEVIRDYDSRKSNN